MELKDKLISRLDCRYFPPRGATLVVAVSGGVDSVVLLYVLSLLVTSQDWKLVVAHFNHQLRRSANQDAKFVGALAKSLGLKYVSDTINVAKFAKSHKLTIEEAGRVARYAWLKKVAKWHRSGIIVLGHTADDQVETVVMNWLRGGLVRALAGMRAKEGNLWRPFLQIPKTELKQFAKHYHIKFREDKSNRNLTYTRNLIRHRILPVLKKVNSGIEGVILRNAESFSDLESWVENQVQDVYKKVSGRPQTGTVNFSAKQFKQVDRFLQNELFLLAIQKLKGDRQDIKKVHLDEMQALLHSAQSTAWKQLPGKLFVYRGYGKISVSRHRPKFVNK